MSSAAVASDVPAAAGAASLASATSQVAEVAPPAAAEAPGISSAAAAAASEGTAAASAITEQQPSNPKVTMAELPPPPPPQPEPQEGGGINIFTQKPYPPSFSDLTYNQTITIESTELPYFAVRSFNDKRVDPLSGPDFANLFTKIEDKGWAELKIDDNTPKIVKDEYEFLEALGLALQNENGYYINKFAYLLYDAQDGLFSRYDNQWSPQDKKEELTAFMRLALTYILPGHWWRAFYARQYLPDMIGHGAMLNEKLLQIEHQWNKIAAQCDMPQT